MKKSFVCCLLLLAFLFSQALFAADSSAPVKAVGLPKVLIIGDSISGGYSKSLIKILDGKASLGNQIRCDSF